MILIKLNLNRYLFHQLIEVLKYKNNIHFEY